MDGYRLNTFYSLEVFRAALKYKPKPDDKFVVSFPKAGTTWTQQIGYLIFHDGVPPSSAQDFHECSPFLDMFNIVTSDHKRPSGFIKTHLSYDLVPKSPQAKYLYVCRNPKDVCVSFYYHTCRFFCYDFLEGHFEDFFEVFMNGGTDNGDYFDHVLSWYEHRNDPNVSFINYEDMKAEPKKSILKIAEFMSENHHKRLVQDQKMLEQVAEYSGIDFMKIGARNVFENLFPGAASETHSPFFVEYSGMNFMKGEAKDVFEKLYEGPLGNPTVPFIRKGIVGDWKGYFSAEMNARMEENIFQNLSHTDLLDVWRKCGIIS
ncbi:unnamed protein product [Ixodes hexagonus]